MPKETLAHIKDCIFNGIPVLICDKIKPDDDTKDTIEWLSKLPMSLLGCGMS